MVTIYDLLEVSENASKEEIEKSYKTLRMRYRISPNLTEQENKENEFIIKKLKMAYDILINDEKREKYDKDLAQKRAEDLIKNVTVKREENNIEPKTNVEKPREVIQPQTNTINSNKETKTERYDREFDDSVGYPEENQDLYNKQDDLTEEEQKRLRKAANDEFQRNLMRAKKAEEEYNQAYNEAYDNYMKKMGYNSTGKKWTLKKILTIIIVIFVLCIVAAIAWCIPPVRTSLTNLYNENAVVKMLTDMFVSIVKSILGIFIK